MTWENKNKPQHIQHRILHKCLE